MFESTGRHTIGRMGTFKMVFKKKFMKTIIIKNLYLIGFALFLIITLTLFYFFQIN
jgi:hypothetical protein